MKPKSDFDELKAMEQKAAQLRAAKKKPHAPPFAKPSPFAKATGDKSGDKAAKPKEAAPAAATPDPLIHDLIQQVETIAKEMETAAQEHPRVALLAAFALGIAAGQLVSRR